MKTSAFVAHFKRTFPNLVGGSVLVALSGGRDSVALLHLLRNPALDLSLSAAHVHHGLRGTEADADAEFCLGLCRDLEIPAEFLRLPDDDETPATGEAAWRRRRYRALLGQAAALDADAVATAHHRDDIAEGVLLQLLRGAGPRAMAGIETRTRNGVIRPLLPWNRCEITAWLEHRKIAWREDGSNRDIKRLRNRVRHQVLPYLENDVPELPNHLVNLAAALAEAETFMANELKARATFVDPWDPRGGVVLSTLKELPRALRTRWLQSQALQLGVGASTRRQLELFNDLLDEATPRSVTLGGRWRLRRARGRLWAEPPEPPTGIESDLADGDQISLGLPGWTVRSTTGEAPHPQAVWQWRPSSDSSAVHIRPAADDDRLSTPTGAPRRVRDLLAETLPRHLRPAWPLFCEDDMIHWIPGVWQHSKPGDPSDRVVEVIRP